MRTFSSLSLFTCYLGMGICDIYKIRTIAGHCTSRNRIVLEKRMVFFLRYFYGEKLQMEWPLLANASYKWLCNAKMLKFFCTEQNSSLESFFLACAKAKLFNVKEFVTFFIK